MTIKELIAETIEEMFVGEDLRELIVNDKGEFSVIWLDNYDRSFGLFGRENNEERAKRLADFGATNAKDYNDYGEDGEVVLGTVYFVYDPKGIYTYTGEIDRKLVN